MPHPCDLEALQHAFASLDPDHRQLLVWARARKLDHAEIGARLGLGIEEVELRLAAAILALDAALAKRKRLWWRVW